MIDYSESLLSLKQELKHLEDACLHNKLDKIPQILKNIDIERDRMEFWYYKTKLDK